MSDRLNRREFLQKMSLLGLGVFGAGSLLNACGKTEESAPKTSAPAVQQTADPCADLSGVPDDQKQLRVTFEYVPKSPDPEKHCKNCGFWVEPAAGSPCGGCKLFQGPVNPAGYCKSWVIKPA